MKLRLFGPGAKGISVPGALLRDVLDVLVDGTQRAVRLRLEGRSTAQGPAPAWVEQAAAFDVRIEAGSTQLVLEAPPLAEAAPEQFAQVRLFGEVTADRSCLDLLTESLDDAIAGRGDSGLFDDALLECFSDFGSAFRHGVEAMELANGTIYRLDPPTVQTFDVLKRRIPPDQRVVLAGKLDLLRHTSRMFTLVLEDGAAVRGVLGGDVDLDRVGHLWGKNARISGAAKFRPSGAVLRIEADDVHPAEGDFSVWSKSPRPLLGELDTRTLHREQGPRSGVSALFGKWPGHETEEEFLRALAEVS